MALCFQAFGAAKAPTNLSAAPVSYSQVNLVWVDASSNEDGFKIERAGSSAGPWSAIGTVGANVSAFSNTSLNGSTIYFYRVTATLPMRSFGHPQEAS